MGKPPFIQERVPLGPLTTLHIGGPALYFAPVTTAGEVRAAVTWALDQRLPIMCLGGGSAVLISDAGFFGLILHPVGWQMTFDQETLVVDAGVQLQDCLQFALRHGRGGLEWLAGVPGQVGGAIVTNAGGRTTSIGSFVDWVEVVMPDGELRRFNQSDCAFGYRHSVFQSQPCAVLRLGLRLPAVDRQAEQNRLAAAEKRKIAAAPTGPCAQMFRDVQPRQALPPHLQPLLDDQGMISVEALIAEVDLAGHQLGQMEIDDRDPNWLLNLGGGTADQAVQLMSLVKQRVRDTLGLQLQDQLRLIS